MDDIFLDSIAHNSGRNNTFPDNWRPVWSLWGFAYYKGGEEYLLLARWQVHYVSYSLAEEYAAGL